MHGYMTTGTAAFLQKLAKQKTDKKIHFMKNGITALLYYEDTKKKSVFVSGRTGDILLTDGIFAPKGFVVMHHIPVTDGETAVFEDKVKGRLQRLAEHPNVNAIRLLKEKKSIYYIVIMQWKKEQDYDSWKKLSDSTGVDFLTMAKLPAYFSDRPFTNTYYMLQEEQ